MEDSDDLLCATVSESKILTHGQPHIHTTSHDIEILGEISKDVISTVSTEWKRDMQDSSNELQRRIAVLASSEKTTDELITELDDPHPISRWRRTKQEMLSLYPLPTGRVTGSSHSKTTSS